MNGMMMHGAGPKSRLTPIRESTFGLLKFDIMRLSSTIETTLLLENNPKYTHNNVFTTIVTYL